MIAPSCNSARYVGDIAHPFRSRERVVLIVRAYLDDTGTDTRSRITGVIGWAASTDAWISWENEWLAFLAHPDIRLEKGWKQSDFASTFAGRRGEYLLWSEGQWLWARRRVWEILSQNSLFGVGCAVLKSDYEEIVALGKYHLPSNPYEFCLDRCLSKVLHSSVNLPHGEGIAIYCDQSKTQERIGNALAGWHEKYVTLYADAGYRDVPTSTTYGSRIKLIPLQAADIIATEAARACTAVLQGLTREEIDKAYPIVKELRDRDCIPDVVAYEKKEPIAEFERGPSSPLKYGQKL